MKKALILSLLAAILLTSCSKTSLFEKVFRVPIPSGVEVVNELRLNGSDSIIYSYYGKYKCDIDKFREICNLLGLQKTADPLQHLLPALGRNYKQEWWDPPSPIIQMRDSDNVFFKGFKGSDERDGIPCGILAQYHHGVVYIYKTGF